MRYQLNYIIHVKSSKYREFLNLLEKEDLKERPYGCTLRLVSQSIRDLNVFNYFEEWDDLEQLQKHLDTEEFKTLNGGIRILAEVRSLCVSECSEIEELKTFFI